MAGTVLGSSVARDTYIDQGETLDVVQILSQGGAIKAGQTIAGFFYGTLCSADNITAHAGGGQANAFPIVAPINRITIVASAGDSVVLPFSKQGMEVVLLNDAAANACNVFPATGEQINGAGANVAFSLTAQNGAGTGPTIFYCFTVGSWRTK